MTSELKVSSNRANSTRSTGPSLAARAHTRYNGLKTGIRFRGEFLPAERPEEFHERVAVWTQALKPRNAREPRSSCSSMREPSWVHAHNERGSGAANLHAGRSGRRSRMDAGVEKRPPPSVLGPAGAAFCMYALSNSVSNRLQTSWTPEIDDPIEPSVVLKSLEGSAKGCERLIGECKAFGRSPGKRTGVATA